MLRSVCTIVLVAVAAQCLIINSDNAADYMTFQNWMSAQNKVYSTDSELEARFSVFRANIARVASLNAENDGVTYAINKFADLSQDEFRAQYLTHRPGARAGANVAVHRMAPNATATKIDWRDKGAVTPVKDQGQCGSCWAFSATEQIESADFMAGRPLQVLSPQQIVSCDKGGSWGDSGCNGGWTEGAFEYVAGVAGIETEKDYPYKSGTTGTDGSCKYDASKVAVKIKGYSYAVPPCTSGSCTQQDENGLLNQALTSPISICVNADPWQFYSSGVMKGKSCSGSYASQNHCVQIVGFDQTVSPSYWLVRNSWNTDWGYDGYIRLEIGTNCCGVADDAIFATAA